MQDNILAVATDERAAAWTPGPWFYGKPDMFGDFTIQHDSEALAIASVCNGDAKALMGREAEHQANACLIAAAPELYRALEDLWDWVRNWGPEFMDDDEFERSVYENALAKARGDA